MGSSVAEILESAGGKAQKAHGESLSIFIASLTTAGIILGLGLVSYIPLASRFPEI